MSPFGGEANINFKDDNEHIEVEFWVECSLKSSWYRVPEFEPDLKGHQAFF